MISFLISESSYVLTKRHQVGSAWNSESLGLVVLLSVAWTMVNFGLS